MKLQQYPFGYLSLLNAKSGGYTPPDISDEVKPSLDVTQFLKASIALKTTTATTPAQSAVGAGTTVTIPAGEAWQIIGAMAAATLGTAGNSLSYQLSLNPPDLTLGSCCLAYQEPIAVTNAAQTFNLPWSAPDGLILGPGSQFQMQLCLALANSVTAVCRVLYRPLPV